MNYKNIEPIPFLSYADKR